MPSRTFRFMGPTPSGSGTFMSSRYGIPYDRPASMNAAVAGWTFFALDADRAARAAELTLAVLPVLGLLEEGQYGMEVPASVAGLRPVLVIGPVAAGPDHGVDAARPAEHLSERQRDGAVIDVRTGLVTVSPVVWRANVFHPLRRGPEAIDSFIRSADLEHEHGRVGVVQ